MLRKLISAIGLCLFLAACATTAPAERPLTVLISIDGFRPDYLDRGVTPVLARLAANGAQAAMRPSFPTKTFPNHYTLVTGLRPDRHGIVDNTMLDPAAQGVTFSMGNAAAVTDGRWWSDGTPLWVSAERAGVRSGTMFWPGSEAAIQGVRPSKWAPFDQKMSADARVDQVLAWLGAPAGERPRFVTLYFDEVDTAGHNFGPDSAEVNAAAARTDAAIGRLILGLGARGLAADLVIVADHGMAATAIERRIIAEDVLPQGSARVLSYGAFATFYANPGREPEVAQALLKSHPHMQCWRKGEVPARFHYGRHRRVPPFVCLPEVGWEVVSRDRADRPAGGAHGYDPAAPEMAALFIAHGPSIRPGVTLPAFDNVDVYPLLARLLGVRPEPGDGQPSSTTAALAR
jgi:predicted AlkP superfamily pyrophosphatase or phosphodiesterase